MKFRYIGECSAGFVQFGDVVMPEGEAVEVPEWLAKKLAANSHFETVEEEATPESEGAQGETPAPEAPKRRGRKPKANDAG